MVAWDPLREYLLPVRIHSRRRGLDQQLRSPWRLLREVTPHPVEVWNGRNYLVCLADGPDLPGPSVVQRRESITHVRSLLAPQHRQAAGVLGPLALHCRQLPRRAHPF